MADRTIRIGTAEAAPGTKARGIVTVANRPDGSPIYIPVMIANGVQEGPVLGIDGATHGDEYEGPEAVQALMARLDPKQLTGVVIGVPVVNVQAFHAMQRVTPNDTLSYPDLNRNYPGKPHGGLTQRIAYVHFNEIVARTNVMITIHSGASIAMLPPKIIYHETAGELGKRSLEAAKAFGWEILWRDGSYDGTLHRAAEERDIVCLAPEIGGTDRLSTLRIERRERLLKGITNVMKHLGMIKGEPELPSQWTVVEGESHVFANCGGIVHYPPDFELGKEVHKGQAVARIVDFFGDELETLTSPVDGRAMFMRTIPLVNVGDWVVGVGKYVRTIERT